MSIRFAALARRLLLGVILTATCVLAVAGSAFAGSYVDNALPDLKPEERKVVANPAPVQLVFEFQTKGVVNQRAIKQVKPWVVAAVQSSGLFSAVTETPAPNGALLVVMINNVPAEGENAAAKGFVTGLTFGLKGTTVQDLYDCTLEYAATPESPKATRKLRHGIITTIGAAGEPPNATKMKNVMAAVETMVRQVVSRGLNDMAEDPAIAGVPEIAPQPAAEPQPDTVPAPAAPPEPTPPAAPADALVTS